MVTAIWRPDMASLHKGVDAQKVADEIMSIGEYATPEQIVERGRPEDSELHKCFEWDDEAAARQYRIVQAREIVRHLVIEEKSVGENPAPPVRFFVEPQRGQGYKQTELVFRREDEYQQLLRQAYAELRAFKEKYSRLSELREIFDLIA